MASKPRNPKDAAPAASGPLLVVKYDFGHTKRCPRCRGTQTKLDNVRGEYAYRECQAPICRHRWPVIGKAI